MNAQQIYNWGYEETGSNAAAYELLEKWEADGEDVVVMDEEGSDEE